MLRLLLGKDWTANRDKIFDRIARDVAQKKPGRILLVPELISHETERRLCLAAGDTASRYAQVLSFTRLAGRVSEAMGIGVEECLDGGGRIVAMAAVAKQLSSRLKSYASVETKPEFLSALVDGVDEFKRCCISAADLSQASRETVGTLAQKLEELSLLMEGYDGLCARGKRDPRDQMTWLLEQMEAGSYAGEHTFYIDGFPDFTRQHMAILEHLILFSPQVTVSLNCDSVGSTQMAYEKAGNTAFQLLQFAKRSGVEVIVEKVPERVTPLTPVRERIFQGRITPGEAKGSLFVFRAESLWDECMAAAEQVEKLVRSGCRYRDITLVCTDMAAYKSTAEMIFHRMHIPLYQSGTEDILQKSVLSTALSALEASLGDFEQRFVFRFLRSALSPLSLDEQDRVENYAIVWGIRGSRWTAPWVSHPEGLAGKWDEKASLALEELNACRVRLVEPLNRLRNGFRKAGSLRDQVAALTAFLDEIEMQQKLQSMAEELDSQGENREAQILSQLWEILISALEQMYDILGDTHWEDEQFLRLLRLLLSQYDVGTIPPVLDAVQMGPVSAMRCHQQKHLILLGAQEGSLPGYPGSTGVLTDQERVALRQLGVPLTGGAMEGIQAEFAEIYGVFCGAEESIRVFCSGAQPSFIFRRLAELAGGEGKRELCLDYACADPWEAGAWLARWDAEKAAGALGALKGYQDICCRRSYSLGRVERDRIEKLYGRTLNLSASQIDAHGECRMSYFLKYGLRLREQKEASVDPAEFGTYVHAVLENTAKCVRDMGGFHQVSLEETLEIAHRYSREYALERFGQLSSERMSYLFRRNVQELDMVVRELWTELKESLFEPRDFEVNFGSEDGLPPIAIPNGKMNALLRGFVDRVDTWLSGGSSYYRVVDYKTGKKDFDYCDIFNGVGLQMLLYLFALRTDGEALLGDGAIPAGVQYFPARCPYLPSDGALTPEQAEAARQAQWKRKGILLEDEAVIRAMEPGDSPSRLCCSVRKDGTLTGDLADREQLKLLEKYVFRLVGEMVEDIACGNVEANPYTRGASHNACAFCPYGSICHKADDDQGRRNYKAMTAQRFWEEVEKEVRRHGG